MSTPDLKVVQIHETNFRDPAATMRVIADAIDNNDYGPVGSVAVVLLGNRMEVFGMGQDSEAPSTALLLHAGFMRLSKAIEEHDNGAGATPDAA